MIMCAARPLFGLTDLKAAALLLDEDLIPVSTIMADTFNQLLEFRWVERKNGGCHTLSRAVYAFTVISKKCRENLHCNYSVLHSVLPLLLQNALSDRPAEKGQAWMIGLDDTQRGSSRHLSIDRSVILLWATCWRLKKYPPNLEKSPSLYRQTSAVEKSDVFSICVLSLLLFYKYCACVFLDTFKTMTRKRHQRLLYCECQMGVTVVALTSCCCLTEILPKSGCRERATLMIYKGWLMMENIQAKRWTDTNCSPAGRCVCS